MYFSTLTVANGSHIDGNTAKYVSSPASLWPRARRWIDKGQSTLRGVIAFARARRMEEAPTCLIPR